MIPILLLQNKGLVKTKKFGSPKYVGDPINAIRIFNEKMVDELVFLDIMASKHGHEPNFELINNIASECFMPLGYGGGIRNIEQITKLFRLGIEKVILNSQAINKPGLLKEAARRFGSQSIVVSIDIKKSLFGSPKVYNHVEGKSLNIDLMDYLSEIVQCGVGEIIINSVDRDGMMSGYDLKLIQSVTDKVQVPVVAVGGAGNLEHLKEVRECSDLSGVGAGSLFVFHGPHRAVLINYPSYDTIQNLFS